MASAGAFLRRMDGSRGLWEKVHRFPYIKKGEPFITGDATIVNMMEKVMGALSAAHKFHGLSSFYIPERTCPTVPRQPYSQSNIQPARSNGPCVERISIQLGRSLPAQSSRAKVHPTVDAEGSDTIPDQMSSSFSFPNIVRLGVEQYRDCMKLYKNKEVSDEESHIADHFSCKTSGDPYNTVWKGLYYYPVLQWLRKFGMKIFRQYTHS